MLNRLRPHVGHPGRKEKVDDRLILRREEIFPRYQQKVVFQILEERDSFFRCSVLLVQHQNERLRQHYRA